MEDVPQIIRCMYDVLRDSLRNECFEKRRVKNRVKVQERHIVRA